MTTTISFTESYVNENGGEIVIFSFNYYSRGSSNTTMTIVNQTEYEANETAITESYIAFISEANRKVSKIIKEDQ